MNNFLLVAIAGTVVGVLLGAIITIWIVWAFFRKEFHG